MYCLRESTSGRIGRPTDYEPNSPEFNPGNCYFLVYIKIIIAGITILKRGVIFWLFFGAEKRPISLKWEQMGISYLCVFFDFDLCF